MTPPLERANASLMHLFQHPRLEPTLIRFAFRKITLQTFLAASTRTLR